jgi:hypothetical protein
MTAPRVRPYRRGEMGWSFRRQPGWIYRKRHLYRAAVKKRQLAAIVEAVVDRLESRLAMSARCDDGRPS